MTVNENLHAKQIYQLFHIQNIFDPKDEIKIKFTSD